MIVINYPYGVPKMALIETRLKALYPGAAPSFDDARKIITVEGVADTEHATVEAAIFAEIPNQGVALLQEVAYDLRQTIADVELRLIRNSQLARAILEGGDVSGYTTEQVMEMQGRLIRVMYAQLFNLNWPIWSLNARSE